jgi:hypothetical protein
MKKPMKRKFLGDKHFILANILTNVWKKNITRGTARTLIEVRNVCLYH